MALSKRFVDLRKRLSTLRRNLLPAKFSSIGTYANRVQDRARGYRLLAHAEIEAYLEDVVKSVVIDKIIKWKQARTPSNLIVAFLACYHSGWVEYDEDSKINIIQMAKSRKGIDKDIEEIIDQAQRQFMYLLQNNHGVREENLKILVLPTGIDLKVLNPTWITDLDDFGKKRGELAHTAITTTATVNPQDEYNRVKSLLIGLKDLDKKINEII